MIGGRFVRRDERGLTLMEIIVVLAIFSVTMLLAVDIFFAITTIQRRTSAEQRVQSDARFLLEALTREVRSGALDYDFYGGNLAPPNHRHDVLVVFDPEGNQRRYRYFPAEQKMKFCTCPIDRSICPNNGDLLVVGCPDGNGNPTWQDITPNNVDILAAEFYLAPEADPFAITTTPIDTQPFVTVALESTSTDLQGDTVLLQSTIASRIYAR